MSAREIDDYLEAVPEPQRSTLRQVRAVVEELLPDDIEPGIAYGLAAYKLGGVGVAGFGAYKDHCTYAPMSGSITAELADVLAGFDTTKGAVRFPADTPLPREIIAALLTARRAEIARSGR
jgi:uncharacterized protein YdhG (YjbR/CyaY superfamily)